MTTSTLDSPIDLGPDEFPFYEQETATPSLQKKDIDYLRDATSLSTYLLSRATAPSPNTLVPTGTDGKLPIAIIPALAGTGSIIGATGTYAALKAAPLAGIYLAWATDVGLGALFLYTANASIGDSGWLLIAGG